MKKDKKEKKEKKEKRASAPQPVIPVVKRNVDLDSLPQDPLEYALSRVGGKWKLRILWGLGQSSESGGLRYGDLKEKIPGITDMIQSKLEGSNRSRPDPAHPVSGDSASGRIRFDAGGKLPSAGDRFLIRLGGRADEKQLMTRIPGLSGPRFYSQTPKGPGQKSHFSFVPGLWGFCADSASY